MASALAAVEADAPARVHREKEAAVGDQLNPLIAWYSLVAKPITRKLLSYNATRAGRSGRRVGKAVRG